VKFFFDATFSEQIPEILAKLGVDTAHLKQHFPQGTDDPTWLPWLASKGWTLVSGDIAIAEKRGKPEYQILREAKIISVFFHKGFTRFDRWEQTWKCIKWWPQIQKMVETGCSLGDIIRVTANGKPEKSK